MQLLLDIALFIYLKNLSHIKILTENIFSYIDDINIGKGS